MGRTIFTIQQIVFVLGKFLVKRFHDRCPVRHEALKFPNGLFEKRDQIIFIIRTTVNQT